MLVTALLATVVAGLVQLAFPLLSRDLFNDVFAAEEAATLAALDELVAQDLSAVRGAADLSETRETTDEALDSLRSYIRRLGDPAPITSQLEVAELADSSVNFTVRAWVNSADYWPLFFYM